MHLSVTWQFWSIHRSWIGISWEGLMDCATVGGGLAQVGNKAQRWEGLKCEDTMSSYYFTNFQLHLPVYKGVLFSPQVSHYKNQALRDKSSVPYSGNCYTFESSTIRLEKNMETLWKKCNSYLNSNALQYLNSHATGDHSTQFRPCLYVVQNYQFQFKIAPGSKWNVIKMIFVNQEVFS